MVFCRASSRSLITQVLSSLHLLYLSLNSLFDLGRNKFECLLVFSVLYLPLRSIYLQPYSLCSGCVESFTISNILLRRWYRVSRSSCFNLLFPPPPPISPTFSHYYVQSVFVLFLNVTSTTGEGKSLKHYRSLNNKICEEIWINVKRPDFP